MQIKCMSPEDLCIPMVRCSACWGASSSPCSFLTPSQAHQNIQSLLPRNAHCKNADERAMRAAAAAHMPWGAPQGQGGEQEGPAEPQGYAHSQGSCGGAGAESWSGAPLSLCLARRGAWLGKAAALPVQQQWPRQLREPTAQPQQQRAHGPACKSSSCSLALPRLVLSSRPAAPLILVCCLQETYDLDQKIDTGKLIDAAGAGRSVFSPGWLTQLGRLWGGKGVSRCSGRAAGGLHSPARPLDPRRALLLR